MSDPYHTAPVQKRFAADGRHIFPGESDLYARLAEGVADDPEILAIAAAAPSEQPTPVMFFGAVHYLLLRGAEHTLRGYYPSLGGESTGDPYPAFRDFCVERAGELQEILTTRRVQTNEVRRCALLMPMYTTVAVATGADLAVVEFGTSAGLNLIWDRYHYDYGAAGSTGDPAATVRLACESRHDPPPVPVPLPTVVARAGIDLHPLDVTDPDQADWLRALVWPEQRERRAVLEAALAEAAADPPPIRKGDALDLLPGIIAELPDNAAVCVTHSFVLNQFPVEQRDALGHLLRAMSVDRPIHRIAAEWLLPHRAPALELTTYREGEHVTRFLGHGHHHGAWIDWGAEPRLR